MRWKGDHYRPEPVYVEQKYPSVTADYVKKSIKEQLQVKKKLDKILKKASRRSEFAKYIKPQGVTFISGVVQPYLTSNNMYGFYYRLLKTKVTDERLIKDIIKYRDKLLKHRVNAEVKLMNGADTVARMSLVGVLPENVQASIITNFRGMLGDDSTIKAKMELFLLNTIKSGKAMFGSHTVDFKTKEAIRINRVEVNYSFA